MENFKKGELIRLIINDKEILKVIQDKGVRNYHNGKIYKIDKRGAYIGFGRLAIVGLHFKDRYSKKLHWGIDEFPINDVIPKTNNQILHFTHKLLARIRVQKRNPDFNINDTVRITILKPIEYLRDVKGSSISGKILSYDLWNPPPTDVDHRNKKVKRMSGSIIVGCGMFSKFIKTTDLPANTSYIYPDITQQIDFDKNLNNMILKLPIRDIEIYFNIKKT